MKSLLEGYNAQLEEGRAEIYLIEQKPRTSWVYANQNLVLQYCSHDH